MRASWPLAAFLLVACGCGGLRTAGKGSELAAVPTPELERRASTAPQAAVFRELAHRMLQEERLRECESYLQRALELEPRSSDAYNLRGMLRATEGAAEAAADDFRRAAELAPDKIGPHLNLGRLLISQRHYQSAAAEFEKALALHPASAEAARLAGDARREGGPSLLAKRHYRRALELRPDDTAAHAGLGEVLTNTGRFAEGREHLRQARALGDASARTQGYLGLACALGIESPADAGEALQHLEAARAGGDTGSHVVYGLGLAYLAAGKHGEAERVLREGIRRFPDVSGLHYTLADLYAATGRARESRSARSRSAALTAVRQEEERLLGEIAGRPQDVEPYRRYGAWLLRRGERARAKPVLAQALRLAPDDPALQRDLRLASGEPDPSANPR
ncbi:MAG: tetratricopeptide repeat protein [Armatimonadota bacterium]